MSNRKMRVAGEEAVQKVVTICNAPGACSMWYVVWRTGSGLVGFEDNDAEEGAVDELIEGGLGRIGFQGVGDGDSWTCQSVPGFVEWR